MGADNDIHCELVGGGVRGGYGYYGWNDGAGIRP
jgi:hypothetical protein